MPKVSIHKEAALRRTIRDAIALDPIISLRKLQKVVEKKHNTGIQLEYLSKLVNKVSGEMMVRADMEKVEERIQSLRERNRILTEELLRIAFPSPTANPQPSIMDRRLAIEAIARIESNQVKLEMDLGLFTRKIGTVDVNVRLRPLDDTTRLSIVNAMKVWDVKPVEPRKIEATQVLAAPVAPSPTHEPITSPTAQPEPIPLAEPVVIS